MGYSREDNKVRQNNIDKIVYRIRRGKWTMKELYDSLKEKYHFDLRPFLYGPKGGIKLKNKLPSKDQPHPEEKQELADSKTSVLTSVLELDPAAPAAVVS